MVPKPKNMAAAHSSVALPKSFVVWKPPLDEQCDSYLAMRLRYLWALLWEESVEPWKLLFDIQGDGNNTTVNLQSAGRQHTLWQLRLNYFDYHRPRWVKILFYGRGCMAADVIKWKTMKLIFFFFVCSIYRLQLNKITLEGIQYFQLKIFQIQLTSCWFGPDLLLI